MPRFDVEIVRTERRRCGVEAESASDAVAVAAWLNPEYRPESVAPAGKPDEADDVIGVCCSCRGGILSGDGYVPKMLPTGELIRWHERCPGPID